MMRTIIPAICTCVAILGIISGTAEAQTYIPTPVTVSKDKVKGSDGKVYWSHVVLEKQTLFSIAKAYGVKTDDILKANPNLDLGHEGLKKNSILLIPVVEAAAEAVKEEPEQKRPEKTADKKKNDSYTIHVTKWYEDIGDIAYKYSIPKEVLMKYNGLTSEKLKNRQKLRIPSPEVVKVMGAEKESAAKTEHKTLTDNVSVNDVQQPEVQEEETESPYMRSKVNALLMLPMNASSSPSESNMDFYSGVLMAVRDLGKQGISTDLSVYDVAGGAMPITTERLKASDFCIGPVNKDGISRVLELAPEDTYIISPLDHRTSGLVADHKNMIQTPTSQQVQYADLLDWIRKEKGSGDHVIVISESGMTGPMTHAIENSGIPHTNYSYAILQGRNVANALTSIMTSTGTNRVIINSESEAFVNDAVRNLDMLVYRKFNVILYSPSKIRSFETIDVDNLHNLKTRVSTAYYIDYESPAVRRFLLEYRALYNTEPTQFSFQGYDLAYFFIFMKTKFGKSWMEKVARLGNSAMMQTDFLFRESSDGGYINEGVRRIVYGPDYSVRIVRE